MNNYFKIYCMLRAVEICCDHVLSRGYKILPIRFKEICLELSSKDLFEYGLEKTDDIMHWGYFRVYGALERLKVLEIVKSYEGHEEDKESVLRCFERLQDELTEWEKTVDLNSVLFNGGK